MSRLIDADVAIENIEEWLNCVGNALIGKGLSYTGELMGCIEDAPTVDAVPVVRCAKCEHWVKNDDGQYVCALFDIANSYGEPVVTKPDNFCSYGKRKGEVD